MRPLSIRASLTAWFVGLTMLLLGGFSVTLYSSLSRALRHGLDAELEARAEGLAGLSEWDEDLGGVEFGRSAELVARLETGIPGRGCEVSTWPEGKLLHASGDPLPTESSAVNSADEARPFALFTTVAGATPRRLCTVLARMPAIPAGEDDESDPAKPGFEVLVRVSDSLAPVEAQLARVGWLIGGLIGLSSLVVVAFGLFLSRRFVQPLKQLGNAAAAVRIGTLTPMPRRGSADEVDQLAAILDATFVSLDDTASRQARFTANAAHELRNPITVIRNAADVALRRDRSSSEYREFLGDVLATADRMGTIVQALLTLARMDEGVLRSTFAEVDLLAIARESAAVLAKSADRVRFTNGTATVIHGEPRLLRVLADNLLANALRFSAGQPVDVIVGTDERGGISLCVRDFGPGVPESHRKRVFERFYRVEAAEPEPSGAGLGLSIVAEVARVHAAECGLEDASPGTRVTVRFPASPLAPASHPSPSPPTTRDATAPRGSRAGV